jgi:Cyclic nucleotide-binding domain
LSIFSVRKSGYWKRPTIRRVHGERVSTDALLKGNAVPKPLPSFWPLLNDPHKFLVKIGAGRSTSNYAKNSDVFVQGTDADSIFYLQEGRVKVTVTSEQGEEATVAILEAGQFFGVGCLSGQTHRIVTTNAMSWSTFLVRVSSGSRAFCWKKWMFSNLCWSPFYATCS